MCSCACFLHHLDTMKKLAFLFACITATALGACDDAKDPVKEPEPLPVTINAQVNVQVTDAPIDAAPEYTITSFLSAKQGTIAASAKLDSIIVSYRLNDAPFVVGRPLFVPVYVGFLPFAAQAGDHYTVYARMYSHATGVGGRSASAISDFNVSGMAIDTTTH